EIAADSSCTHYRYPHQLNSSSHPPPRAGEERSTSSVTIRVRLERARDVDTEVAGLLIGEWSQHRTQFRQLQPRDLFVQMLRQHVDTYRISARARLRVRPQLDLRHHLIRKRRAH